MKIRNSFERTAGLVGGEKKDTNKTRSSRGASFQSQFSRKQDQAAEEYVKQMLEGIDAQGEKLKERMDVGDLKVYKQLISEFLYEAVNNSHVFLKESKLDRRGRHKVWAIIKKVNEELDNLTKEVLRKEKDNIQILKSMDDIRGLLLDIAM
jgi:uncharacterized protein YaaR (DUF327 family)